MLQNLVLDLVSGDQPRQTVRCKPTLHLPDYLGYDVFNCCAPCCVFAFNSLLQLSLQLRADPERGVPCCFNQSSGLYLIPTTPAIVT
jgi:hypothetical protein